MDELEDIEKRFQDNLLWGSKYFTPDIEDIRVGYVCEVNYHYPEVVWEESTVSDNFHFQNWTSRIADKAIRVPYLTKEQIEAEGWIYKGKSIDIWFEKDVLHRS